MIYGDGRGGLSVTGKDMVRAEEREVRPSTAFEGLHWIGECTGNLWSLRLPTEPHKLATL